MTDPVLRVRSPRLSPSFAGRLSLVVRSRHDCYCSSCGYFKACVCVLDAVPCVACGALVCVSVSWSAPVSAGVLDVWMSHDCAITPAEVA